MSLEVFDFFIKNLMLKDFIDLFLLWIIFYQIFKFAEKSGVYQVILGLGVVALAFFISAQLELIAVHTLLQNIFSNLFLVLALIFRSEIRKGLTQIGSQNIFKDVESVEAANMSEEISKALVQLSKRGIGALIVFEKNIDISGFVESGVVVSSNIKSELIEAMFHPSSKIHDGAIVINGGKIESAGVFLPLSTNPALDRNLGTRHRAALGLSEVSDAKVIVLSEESQRIAFVEEGRLRFAEDKANLSIDLRQFLALKKGTKR